MEIETIIIKRYANRKLYDTVRKEYITLNGLSKLIREGAEIQVIDNESGEDLTARTLTQIILEQENLGSSLIPKSFLINLIRTGEDQIATLQRNFQGSLGSWRQIDEKIASISKQKLIPTREDINQLIHQLDELEAKIENAVQSKEEKGEEPHGK